jgi:hypothetical protein
LGPPGTSCHQWPIVPAPGDYDDGEIGGVIGRGNGSTRRKPAPVPLCPPQTSHACPDANPGGRGGKPATNRFSYDTVLNLRLSNKQITRRKSWTKVPTSPNTVIKRRTSAVSFRLQPFFYRKKTQVINGERIGWTTESVFFATKLKSWPSSPLTITFRAE